jgi:(hydroxyamino)benzene mutase
MRRDAYRFTVDEAAAKTGRTRGDMAQSASQEGSRTRYSRGNNMDTTNRHLMWHGMFLFLLGLLTGLLEQHFTNVRMGLSAHLEGLFNGIFLIALGAIWTEVRLPPWAKSTAYWAALYSTYANWLVTTLAAVFGTAANTPIASAGHTGQPWQESLVGTGFLSVAVVIIACSLLVLWGLWPRALPSKVDVSPTAEGSTRRVRSMTAAALRKVRENEPTPIT